MATLRLPDAAMVRGIINDARNAPFIATSLLCLWGVVYMMGGYGWFEILPAVWANTEKVAAVSEQVEAVEQKIDSVETKLDEVSEVVTSGRISDLDKALIEYRTRQCTASTAESRRYWAGQVSVVLRDYETLTGQQARVPSCDEVQ